VLIPRRDTIYERLCALAKAAHTNDLSLNPLSALDWELAALVSKLNRHPMCWLLQWAIVKTRRPWWDRLLLIAAALLFAVVGGGLMLLVTGELGTPLRWVGVGIGWMSTVGLFYLGSRRLEEWQLKQDIEKCRAARLKSLRSW
jgi:hypothetical protein